MDLRVKGNPSQSVHQSVAGAWLRAGLCLLLLIDSNELAIELVVLFFFSCFVRRYVNFLARLILSLSANTSPQDRRYAFDGLLGWRSLIGQ